MPALLIPSAAAARAHPSAWAAYASHGKWRPAKHLLFLGDRLLDLEHGRGPRRIVVSCPPRHGKSWFISRYYPPWYLGRHPERAVALITFQERFSRKWGRLARDAFHEHAPRLWGVDCYARASTAEWEIYRNLRRTDGVMQSIGAGGAITGKGANLLVVDDLVRDWKECQNPTLREQQWEWFQSAVETRLEPPESVVIISTRWHHEDLIGRLKKLQEQKELGDEWLFINLPALAEEDDALGRKPGEALWPEKYSAAALERKRKNMHPLIWQSLYQGQPVPASGAILKKEWFRYYERGRRLVTVPGRGTCQDDKLERYATVDLAASKKKGADFTVIAIWGYHPGWHVLLLLDLVRKRMTGDEIIPQLKLARTAFKLPVIYAEREGPLLAEKLGNVLKEAVRQGVPVVELTPGTDKLSRAIAASGPLASGQVFFPERASWRPLLEEELLVFTGVDDTHDDQVDAVTYGISIFQEREDPEADDPPIDPPAQGEWWDGRLEDGKPWV